MFSISLADALREPEHQLQIAIELEGFDNVTLRHLVADELDRLQAENDGLMAALHDAINLRKGQVPQSAKQFYDPRNFYKGGE